MTGSGDERQKEFYTSNATSYDGTCGRAPEHQFALYFLNSILDFTSSVSILDVGSGTGEVIRLFRSMRPNAYVVGIEPVEALRAQGYANGIPREQLIQGDGRQLPFADESFECVVEVGVLHHFKRPSVVVSEMLRVAKCGVFLSDTNNLGQGHLTGRIVKNIAYWCGMWSFLNAIRTLGKGYVFEPHDGLWYYYTVLRKCSKSLQANPVPVLQYSRFKYPPILPTSRARRIPLSHRRVQRTLHNTRSSLALEGEYCCRR